MKKQYLYLALSIAALAFSTHIANVFLKSIKLDTTDEGLYSLSEGTKKIINKINYQIELKLYYSKAAAQKGTEGMRHFNSHYNYVRDLLHEYAAISGNNIIVEVIDPRPDTEEEEEALAAGLKKFQITGVESYFFGLVVETNSGRQEIIEFIDPNQKGNLEYLITKAIYKTQDRVKNKVAIISELPVLSKKENPYVEQMLKMQGQNIQDSWFVIQMLQEVADVEQINLEQEKIGNYELLIVIHPREMAPKTILAIEEYVKLGGKLLVLVDPNLTTDQTSLSQGVISTSPSAAFNELLSKFGINVEAGKLAGDRDLAGLGQANPSAPPMKLLPLLGCNLSCVGYNDVISAGLDKIRLIFPGVLNKVEVAGITTTPFLTTTNKGNKYQMGAYEMNHPELVMEKFKDGNSPVNVGLKSIGKWGERESAVVVIADVDFIENQFAFDNTLLGPALINDNPKLFMNAVESLLGSTDLLYVRAKGVKDRSFDVINKIERESEKNTQNKVEQINQSISKYQQEIDNISRQVGRGEDIALLKNSSLQKKKDLNRKLAALKKELREVKRAGREEVEWLGRVFQNINTILVPIFLIILGIYINKKRYQKYTGN